MRRLLISVFLCVSACAKSAGGGAGRAAPPPGPAAGAGDAAPLAELDASGLLANKAVWPAPVGGQAQDRRSFFTFAAPAAGAFYLSKIVVTPVGCDIRQVGARLFAGRLAADGRLESWARVEPFEVIKLGEAQRLLVAVEGDAQAVCGDIEVLLAARFLATLPPQGAVADATSPNVPGPGAGSETGPGSDPGSETGPGSTDVPTTPDPATPVCDGAGPSADDPAILRAALRIYGQRAGGGVCATTFTWRLADVVQRDPKNNCKYPEIHVLEGSGSPLLKLQAESPTLATNLAWLQLTSTGERDAVKAALLAGAAVDLVAPPPFGRPEGERCAVPGVPAAPRLSTDLDLTLFQGDPRESCLGKRGALANLELTDAAHDFRVERAADKLAFTFTWPQHLAAPTGTLRVRAYDRRVKLFVSDWVDFAPGAAASFAASFAGGDTQAALASQGDLELVVAEGAVPAAGTACQRALLFPYARYFLDPAYASAFHGGAG